MTAPNDTLQGNYCKPIMPGIPYKKSVHKSKNLYK